jgi:MarR family transcriptional regulator, organic hydroperoxide resistance regulator
MNRPKGSSPAAETAAILRHWREAVPNDRLAHLVKDATRALSRALQMRLTKYAVSFGHWTFLRILWEADGLTQRELSEQAGVMEPTTFSALKALEQLGYVSRRRLPDSRKKVYVFLTPKGRALKSKLVPLAEEVNEIAVRGAVPADIAATRRTLLIMIENLARDEIQSEEQRRMPSTRELARLVAQGSGGRTRGRTGWRQTRRDRDKTGARVTGRGIA